uniref:ribosomal protein S2 n=1 Tax=Trentepohlia sp. BN17 TaxID=3063876 RepID=UPI001EDF56C7|nr:ribosomal protein S2 [Trentepohlia sp. BN17]UIB38754.1 ribosomal protein S2 [Trentepohlia sp. BN17]
MKQINLKEMYNAGVHLGSSVKKLNPKMKPYIMCTHDGIAIIDILKTYTRLFRITLFLKKIIANEGYQVLFVGTQRSIAPLIAEIATKSSSYYINERWKGGFLTNFKTVKDSRSSRQQDSLEQNQSGFSNELNSLPDLVIIVGQEKELKAIKECQKLNIPTLTILDSDGDPDKTSLFIPANDDSQSSVEFILKHLGQSILIGRLLYDKKKTKYGFQETSTRDFRKL